MEKWCGKVALVTGASAGIGAAISLSLAQAGMKVIGIARNKGPIEKLSKQVASGKGSIFAMKCDLTNIEEIDAVFDAIKKKYGGVDVCINNAGFTTSNSLLDGTPDEWRRMSNVNIVALCYCSKLATQSMVEREIDQGHIINLSSVAAHVTKTLPIVHFYSATKHAVKFLTEGLRQEMIERKLKIRVTGISPGAVGTEFAKRGFGDKPELLEAVESSYDTLKSEDVVSAIKYALSAPPEVEVNDIVVRPLGHAL